MQEEKDNIENINNTIKNKNKLRFSFSINPKILIIDFYNIYCNYINFEKYNTFTKETFVSCIKKIMNSCSSNKVYIVSKPIFEVSEEIILNLTRKYPTLIYIIVIDDHPQKSLNKERDDFICITLNMINKENSFILSNDKYYNYTDILKTIKPFTIRMFNNGKVFDMKTDKSQVDFFVNKLTESKFKPERRPFKFVK